MGVLMRAHNLGDVAAMRRGLKEGLDITLRQRKPLDLLDVYDWVAQDWAPLFQAWSTIWLHGDQEMVRLANDVSRRSGEITVMTRLHEATTRWERLGVWVIGERLTPKLAAEQDEAVRRLGVARRRFADYSRKHLGAEAVDLFA
jgi:hypothetical protein